MTTTNPGILRRHLPTVICVCLHLLLVIRFLVLLVKQLRSPTRPLSVHDNWAWDVYFSYFTPNIILNVYVNILLYITQQLAFKRLLYVEQSLTSVHDKASAWLSLSSAVLSLLNYLDIFTKKGRTKNNISAFFGVTGIALYLGACLVLTSLSTALVYSGYDDYAQQEFLHLTSYLGGNSSRIREAFPSISLLKPIYLGLTGNAGLIDNVIYDVPYGTATPDVSAMSVQFVVNCSTFPGAASLGFDSTVGGFRFHLHNDVEDVVVVPASERSLQVLPSIFRPHGLRTQPQLPTILFATPFQIRDDNNILHKATEVNRTETITPLDCPFNAQCHAVNSVTVLGCNVNLPRQNVSVSYGGNAAIYNVDYGYDGIFSPFWSNWSAPEIRAPGLNEMLSSISQFPSLSPPSSRTQAYYVGNNGTQLQYTPSLLEDQLTELFDLRSSDTQVLELRDINWNLEYALALVYWKEAYNTVINSEDIGTPTTRDGGYDPRYTFLIHIHPTAGALGVSIFMTILAFMLVGVPTGAPDRVKNDKNLKEIDDLGVLQLAWLIARHPQIVDGIRGDDVSPSESALREKGKTIVQRLVVRGEEDRNATAFQENNGSGEGPPIHGQ